MRRFWTSEQLSARKQLLVRQMGIYYRQAGFKF